MYTASGKHENGGIKREIDLAERGKEVQSWVSSAVRLQQPLTVN
jgi:hypothetical protein